MLPVILDSDPSHAKIDTASSKKNLNNDMILSIHHKLKNKRSTQKGPQKTLHK